MRALLIFASLIPAILSLQAPGSTQFTCKRHPASGLQKLIPSQKNRRREALSTTDRQSAIPNLRFAMGNFQFAIASALPKHPPTSLLFTVGSAAQIRQLVLHLHLATDRRPKFPSQKNQKWKRDLYPLPAPPRERPFFFVPFVSFCSKIRVNL